LNGPQVGIIIISDWGTYVWFWIELEAWQAMSTRHLIKHTFGTQVEDQDQAQNEDEV